MLSPSASQHARRRLQEEYASSVNRRTQHQGRRSLVTCACCFLLLSSLLIVSLCVVVLASKASSSITWMSATVYISEHGVVVLQNGSQSGSGSNRSTTSVAISGVDRITRLSASFTWREVCISNATVVRSRVSSIINNTKETVTTTPSTPWIVDDGTLDTVQVQVCAEMPLGTSEVFAALGGSSSSSSGPQMFQPCLLAISSSRDQISIAALICAAAVVAILCGCGNRCCRTQVTCTRVSTIAAFVMDIGCAALIAGALAVFMDGITNKWFCRFSASLGEVVGGGGSACDWLQLIYTVFSSSAGGMSSSTLMAAVSAAVSAWKTNTNVNQSYTWISFPTLLPMSTLGCRAQYGASIWLLVTVCGVSVLRVAFRVWDITSQFVRASGNRPLQSATRMLNDPPTEMQPIKPSASWKETAATEDATTSVAKKHKKKKRNKNRKRVDNDSDADVTNHRHHLHHHDPDVVITMQDVVEGADKSNDVLGARSAKRHRSKGEPVMESSPSSVASVLRNNTGGTRHDHNTTQNASFHSDSFIIHVQEGEETARAHSSPHVVRRRQSSSFSKDRRPMMDSKENDSQWDDDPFGMDRSQTSQATSSHALLPNRIPRRGGGGGETKNANIVASWKVDPETGLFWSKQLMLFFNPQDRRFFDPRSGEWFRSLVDVPHALQDTTRHRPRSPSSTSQRSHS